jgi:hypothetical protein
MTSPLIPLVSNDLFGIVAIKVVSSREKVSRLEQQVHTDDASRSPIRIYTK